MTESCPVLSRITIYPVKSLDGISLNKALVSEGGCLLHDREYAITDDKGNYINGKNNALVHLLRSQIDFENHIVSFRPHNQTDWNHFHLQKEKKSIESFLSHYFGISAFWNQNTTGRFLDVPDRSGVTVISNSSLQSVSEWFDIKETDETRNRFRATLEIEGVHAFWEEQLFTKPGNAVEFKIGDVTLFGRGPRERCVVPTRNPYTGKVYHAFPKLFSAYRTASLPEWSCLKEYGHSYHLSVDCNIPSAETGKWIETGNEVTIIGIKVLDE